MVVLETIKLEPNERPHPQESYIETVFEPSSFWGKLRSLYSEKVLKTQLEQFQKQGSIEIFDLKWHPQYDVHRLHGARTRPDGIPPSLFWESDVGTWVEGVCYFLASPDGASSPHAAKFKSAIQMIVDKVEKMQQPDGYMDIYFTVVDPEGRFQNLRDMHEMYKCGHLLEGAMAHHQLTGSRQFLDCMIKYVNLFMKTFGPAKDQLHGYPGHPLLEMAILRLYNITRDPAHLDFAHYLLAARGVKEPDQNDKTYYVWEAEDKRDDLVHPSNFDSIQDVWYHQAHLPLHEQNEILGHSVRAFYLIAAAADLGGKFLDDAKRLWADAVDNKMYVTGGFGTEPRWEGFDVIPHYLPQSTDEGGCYVETCASIGCMLVSERILSHGLDGRVRDVMELCLMNTVLGGGSLDGKRFSYENKQATYGDEVATRKEWFGCPCCPPNLSRTLGMLGGYTWASRLDTSGKTIHLNVYLLMSATRTIPLPGGGQAKVMMESEMPWKGRTEMKFEAPEGWKWTVSVPKPDYAADVKVSEPVDQAFPGFLTLTPKSTSTVTVTFSLPIRLLSPHPATNQDTLTVSRGPIIYTAESFDNDSLDSSYPHFTGIGMSESTTFTEHTMEIEGIPMIGLASKEKVYALNEVGSKEPYRVVGGGSGVKGRSWKMLEEGLVLVPWFARANRGGKGRVRTAFIRVGEKEE